MDSQKPQVETLIRHDHSPVFFRVTKDGESITSDSNGSDREHYLLPKNHTEIVRQCLESGNCLRNVYSRENGADTRWDYFPVPTENCVHVYGTPLINGRTESRNFIDDRILHGFMYRASDAIVIYDNTLRILYSNLKILTLLGYSTGELLGKSLEMIIPMKCHNRYPLIHELHNGDAFQIRDRILLRKNGTFVDTESSEQILPGDRYILVIRDISQRKSSHREFSKAIQREIYEKLFIKLRLFKHGEGMVMNLNRLALFVVNAKMLKNREILERFIFAVEEFRKIIYPELQYIGDLLRVLQYNEPHDHSSGDSLPRDDSIMKYANRLKELLASFADTVETDNPDDWLRFIQNRKYDISDTITEIISVISWINLTIKRYFICSPVDIVHTIVNKYRSGRDGVLIQVTENLSHQYAVMNNAEFGEVMEILIENALDGIEKNKHNLKGVIPCIKIHLSDQDEKIQIEIEDNGTGVPEAYRDVIFNKGFSTKGPGHGFGLSYSADCIRKYCGEIFHEPGEGSGARFVIELLRAHND